MKASRESVAYELDASSARGTLDTSRFDVPAQKEPVRRERQQVDRQPKPRGERRTADKKTKKGARIRHRLVTPARLFCAAFVGLLCVCLIYSQMLLTVQTHKLSQCESDLKVLESEYVSLMSKYEQQYSAEYVADYAENTLGMVKLSPSQIEYIELAGKEGIEVSSSAPVSGGVVGSLMRGFTALLEYLR